MNLGTNTKKVCEKKFFALTVNIPNHARTLVFLKTKQNRKYLRTNKTSSIVQLKLKRKAILPQTLQQKKIVLSFI